MVVRRMSSQEASANFAKLLGQVHDTKEPVIVEKKGKPLAVVVSPEQYEQIEQNQDHLWSVVDEIRERNRDKDPDEVLRDVTAIVEEVRRERYEMTTY